MSFPSAPYAPPPPSPRAASSLAALLLLVLVFIIGVTVGASGFLASPRSTTPPSTPGTTAGSTAGPTVTTGPSPTPGDLQGMDLFWQALAIIRQNYVGRADITDQQLVYGAIRGMVEALGDTHHTVFLTPQQVQDARDALNQSVVGIGVSVGTKADQVVILSVIPDSPAKAAGLKSGDVFVSVDGESVAGQTLDEVVSKVRGEAGTTVEVSVDRPSTGETIDVSIVREQIHVPAAWWNMVPGTQVALIRLASFGSGASDDFKATRDAAAGAGATSIVLDLRGNPGGYVDQAVQVASQFLTDKVVYISEDANGTRTPVSTDSKIQATDIPLVLLIDGNTASSAEILAGAIQSAHRATLVGETTFGTGTVLLPFDLPDGSSINLATARWLTPDGVLIFGKGITPDDPVNMSATDIVTDPADLEALPADQVADLKDPQLLRALQLLGVPLPTPAVTATP